MNNIKLADYHFIILKIILKIGDSMMFLSGDVSSIGAPSGDKLKDRQWGHPIVPTQSPTGCCRGHRVSHVATEGTPRPRTWTANVELDEGAKKETRIVTASQG